MLFRALMVCLLAAATALAQTSSPAKTGASQTPATAGERKPASTAAPAPTAGADVSPNEPVITLHGLCEGGSAASGSACEKKVTREQFEALLQAFNPSHQNVTPPMRRNLAQAYVELLAFAEAAERAGIENGANYKEIMRVLRLRTLADLYGRSLEEEYRNPPASEIEKYYNEHVAEFQNMKLRRVYVPRFDPTGKASAPDQKAAFDAKAQKVAEDMYGRASKGENMEQLQKDAYNAMDIKSTAPSTDMGGIRKGALPPDTDKALAALAPGGVYKASDATSYVIYKVESKEQLPLANVKDEIARNLARVHIEEKKKEVSSSVKVDFDDKYFGAPTGNMPAIPRPDR
ncbi:MAG TPA: peptidylprolyl isomerase [Candidatus Limnocylindrales bacterium]|nr:peptidylprolyl isomerase [Candidatus Limnocylindrales bacterium]